MNQKLSEKKDVEMSDPRFKLIDEFSVIVPKWYRHATCLTDSRLGFNRCNPNITDEHFKRVTIKLVPGQKFQVKVFKVSEIMSSGDCITFLKSQKVIFAGAQGASLVCELEGSMLPEQCWLRSFDERDALWIDAEGYHRVPTLHHFSDEAFELNLSYFEKNVGGNYTYLLCLCECDD